jgi:hypothetical protein
MIRQKIRIMVFDAQKKYTHIWTKFYFYFIDTPIGVYIFSIVKNITQTGYIFFSTENINTYKIII